MYRNVIPFANLPPLDRIVGEEPFDLGFHNKILYASGVGYRPIPVYADHNRWGAWRPAQAVTSLLCAVDGLTLNVGSTAEQLVSNELPLILPANFIYLGDVLNVKLSARKAISTGTTRFRLRYGSSATAASNTVVWDSGALANTNLSFGFDINLKHMYNDVVRVLGNGDPLNPFGGGSTVSGTGLTTVHDPWTTPGYLHFTVQMSVGSDNIDIYDTTIHLITGWEQLGNEVYLP